MKGFIHHKGKGEKAMLPNREAVNQLATGEAWKKNINNYAKLTPSGEGALDAPNTLDMVQVKY